MHILMLTGDLSRGGAETHLTDLGRELLGRGHRVCLLSGGGEGLALFRDTGIETVRLAITGASPLRLWSAYRALLRFLRERRRVGDGFDLIHCHSRRAALLGCTAAKRMGIPSLVTVHGIYRTTPLLRCLSRFGDLTLAISRDVAEQLAACGVGRDRILLTANGIDTARFRPEEASDAPASHRIVALSRLDADTVTPAAALLSAFPTIRRRYPDATLTFVGGGTALAELRQQAEPLCKRYGENAIIFLGACTDVPARLGRADLVIAVSRAAMEAAASGKLVLCIGQYGQGGLLTPDCYPRAEETNFCFRSDTTHTPIALSGDGVAEKVCAAFSLPAEEKERILAANRAYMVEHHSAARMAEDVLTAADRLVKRRVLVAGYYGYGNLGDELLLEATCRLLKQENAKTEVTVLVRSPREVKRSAAWASEMGIRFLWRYDLPKISHTLARSDALVFGGGGLLQDCSSRRSLSYYLYLIASAKEAGARVVLLANGLGPFLHMRSRATVAEALQGVSVSLRDRGSASLLDAITREAGVPAVPYTVREDLVYTLPLDIDPSRLPKELPQGRLAIFTLRENTAAEWIAEAKTEAARAKASGEQIVLFPMQERDRSVCEAFAAEVGGVTVAAEDAGKAGLFALLALPRVGEVVSARLHLLILAKRFGKRRKALGDDPKLHAEMESSVSRGEPPSP